MYPKGIFEALFQEEKRLIDVMSQLSHKILMSMIGWNVKISNILESDGKENVILTAEINLDDNWRLQPLYLEFFKNHFNPPALEVIILLYYCFLVQCVITFKSMMTRMTLMLVFFVLDWWFVSWNDNGCGCLKPNHRHLFEGFPL